MFPYLWGSVEPDHVDTGCTFLSPSIGRDLSLVNLSREAIHYGDRILVSAGTRALDDHQTNGDIQAGIEQ